MYKSSEDRKEYHRQYYHRVMKKKLADSKITGGKISDSDTPNIIQEYLSGLSTYKLSQKYGVDKTIIRRVLLKNNISLRDNIELLKNRCKENNPNYTGYEGITGTRWCSIKKAAEIRGLEFSITIEEMWALFLKQDKKCALTGIEIFLPDKVKQLSLNESTASLDRIDSSKGYTIDNVQWVHKQVNMMKREIGQKDFIEICRKVYYYNKEKQNQL